MANSTLGVAEILSQISKIKDVQERQNALGTCAGNKAIMQILHATFHPDVKFLLPDGAPPFTKLAKSVDAQGTLYRESKRFYIFIEGLSPPVQQLKRETLFVQLLESLDPDDADLVLAMKDKRMPYKGITYSLVYNTFPGLLPEPNAEQIAEGSESKKDGRSGRDRAIPCPFGCESSNEDKLFLPGPLAQHIKRVHGSLDEDEDSDDVEMTYDPTMVDRISAQLIDNIEQKRNDGI